MKITREVIKSWADLSDRELKFYATYSPEDGILFREIAKTKLFKKLRAERNKETK